MSDARHWEEQLAEEISAIRNILDGVPSSDPVEQRASSVLEGIDEKLRRARGTKRSLKMEIRLVADAEERRRFETKFSRMEQELRELEETSRTLQPEEKGVGGRGDPTTTTPDAGLGLLNEASAIQGKTNIDIVAYGPMVDFVSYGPGVSTLTEAQRHWKEAEQQAKERRSSSWAIKNCCERCWHYCSDTRTRLLQRLSGGRTNNNNKDTPTDYGPPKANMVPDYGCSDRINTMVPAHIIERSGEPWSAAHVVKQIKERSAKASPFVSSLATRRKDSREEEEEEDVVRNFLRMLHSSAAHATITCLPNGRSQPPIQEEGDEKKTAGTDARHQKRRKHRRTISGFLAQLPKHEYIQQQPLLSANGGGDSSSSGIIDFSDKERRIVEDLHESVFVEHFRDNLHPVYRRHRLTDWHGPQLFAGSAGNTVSLHFDRYNTSAPMMSTTGNRHKGSNLAAALADADPGRHNLFCQLAGKKLWILFPPIPDHEAERAVFRPMVSSPHYYHVSRLRTRVVEDGGGDDNGGAADAVVNHHHRNSESSTNDEMTTTESTTIQNEFPRFAEHARGKNRIEVLLSAGQSLHIPPRWWHTTKSIEAGIAVNWWFTMEEEETL